MRSPGAEGIAEKRGVPAAKELSNERFNEERSMEKPLLVLRRRRSGALLSAAYDARPRRGPPQPGRGFARCAAECAARKGNNRPPEKRSEGLRRTPPRPAPGALRGGVSPRSPRLDRLPALRRQVADQVGRLLIGDSAETRGPTGFCRCVGGLDLQFHPSSYT